MRAYPRPRQAVARFHWAPGPHSTPFSTWLRRFFRPEPDADDVIANCRWLIDRRLMRPAPPPAVRFRMAVSESPIAYRRLWLARAWLEHERGYPVDDVELVEALLDRFLRSG